MNIEMIEKSKIITSGWFWLRRQKLVILDRLRHSRPLLRTWALILVVRGYLSRSASKRLLFNADAHRISLGIGSRSPAARFLSQCLGQSEQREIWRTQRIGWHRYPVDYETPTLHKSIILRIPDQHQKGILMISFESDLLTLLSCERIEDLLKDYIVLFFSSWSPPFFPALWSFPRLHVKELVLGLSNQRDPEMLTSLGFEPEILDLFYSNFVRPEDLNPRDRNQRDVDIVMVANWAKFKRHWVLFKMLRQMNQPELRVVLIGQPEAGRTVDDVRAEARLFGVEAQIEFYNRLPIEEVWDWLARSRISIVTSKREGSCVVAVESMMADTPVALLDGAMIGSAAFINDQTGVLIKEGRDMGYCLSKFLERSCETSPREWAERHIGSTNALNNLEKHLRERNILHQSADFFDVCLRGVLSYRSLDDTQRNILRNQAIRFKDSYGLSFDLVNNCHS
jgi:glycosyltransferase involved in cell wall biosynthesis